MNYRHWVWIAALVALVAGIGNVVPAAAQAPINATVTAENNFPKGIIFRLQASSTAGDITEARLTFQTVISRGRQSAPFDFDPASSVEAEVHVDRAGTSLPPAALIEYQVRVRDSAGNEITTEPQQVTYYPPEYDWQELTSGDATFVWYDGSEEWAQEMVALAAPAVERAAQTYGVDIQAPVRIVAFPDSDSLHEAMPYLQSWVGGITLADLGMTIQIISPDPSRFSWNEVVIPHEIAHLVFDAATPSALAPIPNWLSEGLAMLNEPGDHDADRQMVEKAAREGRLYRLSELRSESFGDHSEVSLGYAQAWSMASYLVETCGDDGLRGFIAELNTGKTLDDAMVAACQFDEQTLYNNWYTELTGSPPAESAAPAQPTAAAESPAVEQPAQQPASAPAQPAPSPYPAWLGPALLLFGLGLFVLAVVLLIGITILMRRASS